MGTRAVNPSHEAEEEVDAAEEEKEAGAEEKVEPEV